MARKRLSGSARLRPIRFRHRVTRVARRTRLWSAVFASVAGAAAAAFTAYVILRQILPSGGDPIQPKDLTQFAFAIVAGIGGVVALVVAYRRQQGIEQSRFVERFGAAADQLGHFDVAVRLAGVYAMAVVADESYALERQQCIDVLCGYLRLPYSPALGANHQSELQQKVTDREGEESTHRFQYRQNDKEVRQTIVRVIAGHLREEATESWSLNSFDFRGATLEDADFSGAIFKDGTTSFMGATFSGEQTWFIRATFHGSGIFRGATFTSEDTSFDGATFSGFWTIFQGANFSGDQTSFRGAAFSGETTSFHGATFSAARTLFGGVNFSAQETSFTEATFNGLKTVFGGATFGGARTRFDSATFSGELTSFSATTFRAGQTTFSAATVGAEQTSFDGAKFSGGKTWFDGATFSGVGTWFSGVTFGAGRTSFRGANFPRGTVSFENPKKWDPAPEVGWGDELPDEGRSLKPENVLPEYWPPAVAR